MRKNHTIITRFGGLNQSAYSGDDTVYSPDMLNFRITDRYELEKRDGFETVAQSTAPVRAMWCGEIASVRQLIYVSAGQVVSYGLSDGSSTVIGSIADGVTNIFGFGGLVYIQNGVDYYRYDGSTLESVEGYIPIVAISTPPAGGGVAYETVNMLTAKRRQLFSSDFTAKVYVLAEKELDSIVSVKVNGAVTNQYDEDLEAGTVEFFAPPAAGLNNVEITYSKSHSLRQRITGSSHSMLFGSNADTRIFMWGNPGFRAYRFHSELADGVPSAEYFPELNYTVIGASEITDIVQQYDRQLIFTPDSAYYSYCDVRTDSAGKVYSSFPVFSLNSSKGNLVTASGCAVNGKPVTMCRDGINIWESTAIENEKNAVCFSAPIADVIRGVQAAGEWSKCRLFDFQTASELYFAYGAVMYIFNYRLGVWYAYDGVEALLFCDCYGELYIAGNDNSIYRYGSGSKAHTAYWTSECMTLSQPLSRKDIGSVVLTAVVGNDTEVTLECRDGEERSGMAVSQTFSPSYSGVRYVAARQLRISMRRVHSLKLRVSCGSGKALTLKSIGIISTKKGEAEYGI